MKFSRKASIPAAVAVTLGLVATGVSCKGSKTDTAESGGKTTGPTLAKGDKTVAKPGTPTAAAPAGKTPAAPSPAPAAKAPDAPKAPAAPAAKAPTPAPAPGPVARMDDEPLPPPKPGAPLPPPKAPGTPAPKSPPPVAPTATPPQPPVAPPPTARQPEPARPPVAPPPAARQPEPARPPVAAQPPVAPPQTKPQSEADRILEQRVKELSLEREKRQLLVATYVDNARDAAAVAEWEAVAEWASKALELDHNHAEAEHYLRTARAAQGRRDASIASLTDLMVASKRVKQDQTRFAVQSHLDTAMRAKAAGEYTRALEELELAQTNISNDPTGIEWGDLRGRVQRELAEVRGLKTQSDEAARRRQAADAYRAIKAEEAKVRLAETEKRNALFRSAMDAFEREEYAASASLLEEYIKANPSDRNARALHMNAVRASHQKASEDTLRDQRAQFAKWRLDMQETTTAYHRILTWPSQEHWNTITEKRRELGTISEPVADSPETAGTKAKLRNDRVSFSFENAPFRDVVNFISTAKGLNIYIANDVASTLDPVTISLTLNDVTVEHALRTLNKVAGNLTYVVQGSVVYITSPELAREQPIIKVHAVGDLTVQLTQFIAGNLQLLPANAEEKEDQPRFDKATEGVPSFGGIEDLIELVKKNTASEDYWGAEGVQIAASGTDKMLVIAEPEVQRAVARFLDDLRSFSGLSVTIETRFLTVTDNFLRDVGVDFRGLGTGSPGPLVVLDDVNVGAPNFSSSGADNFGSAAASSASPAAGAFFNNNSDGDYRARTENIFDRALGTKISNIGGAVVQWTLVDDANLSMILRAVEKTQEGRVLNAPMVTVYNTQRANITLINQLTYIQDFDVEVAQTAFIADPIIGIIQDGLVLDVQPTVSHDRKYVTMTLRPTVATLLRPIPTFTTSLGAFTTPVTIQIPELRIEKAQTTVRVPDGGTLLMGGLKSINMSDIKAETPWFSSVPFASFFFGRKGSVKEMDNLMVIVKATISDLQEQERMFRR